MSRRAHHWHPRAEARKRTIIETVAPYFGPFAILVGALLTAANKGARITGYGFIALTIGAAIFTILGIAKGDWFAISVNAALTVVNGVGIRRWLGQVAVAEEAAAEANAASAESSDVETIAPVSGLIGRTVRTADGEKYGEVVDLMLGTQRRKVSYVVIHPAGEAASAFVGLAPDQLRFEAEEAVMLCPHDRCQKLDADSWPVELEG